MCSSGGRCWSASRLSEFDPCLTEVGIFANNPIAICPPRRLHWLLPAPRRGDVRASCTAPRPTPREPTQREDPGQDGKPVDPEVPAERIVELLRDTRRASDDVSGASEPLGVIVTADIELLGLRGRPVLLSWEMYQQEGARRLHGDWLNTNLAYRLVAEAESDATTQDIWIPLPRPAGPFFVRVLAKVDGTRLDSEDSEPFA
jgi:hypothetical protein